MENLKREFVERQAAQAAAQEFVAEIEAGWKTNGSINPHIDTRDYSPEGMAPRHKAQVYYKVRQWFFGQNWELYAPDSMTKELSRTALDC